MPVGDRRFTAAPGDQVPSAAINGMQDDTIIVSGDVGAPADLLTTAKDCTVSAINELVGRVNGGEDDLAAHRLATPIDHPDRSVTAVRIATNVIGATFAGGTDMTLKAVDDEVVAARGTQASLDARLDVSLFESGGFRPYACVPIRGCNAWVDRTNLKKVWVAAGGFVGGSDGLPYVNAADVSVTAGTIAGGTLYYLWLVGGSGAFTLEISTTAPNALGVHPADANKRYRMTLLAADTSGFTRVSKVGNEVLFGGVNMAAVLTTPAADNLLLLYKTNAGIGSTTWVDLMDSQDRVPPTAKAWRLHIYPASEVNGAQEVYLRDPAETAANLTLYDEHVTSGPTGSEQGAERVTVSVGHKTGHTYCSAVYSRGTAGTNPIKIFLLGYTDQY